SSRMRVAVLTASPASSNRAAKLSIPICILRFLLIGCRSRYRILPDGFQLDLDTGLIAYQEAAGLEGHVPVEPEILAIYLCLGGKASHRVSQRIGADTVERHIEGHLARLPADSE